MNSSIRRALTVIAAVAALTAASAAQERDRAKIPDQYKWNLADIYPNEAAWRAAKDKLAAELPQLRQFQGKLALVGGDAGRRARQAVRVRQGAVAALRLRQHAGRPGHARRDAPGHAAGDGAARRRVRRRGRRTSSRRSCGPTRRRVERFIASEPRLEDLPLLPRGRRAPRRAHAQRERREDSRRRRAARRLAVEHLSTSSSNADFPYPSVTLSDGRTVEARSGGVRRRCARCPIAPIARR